MTGAPDDPLVIFTPSGRRGRFPIGTTLLDAGRALGVDIDSVCSGRGLCGRCQVRIGNGAFPKHGITSSPEHVSERNSLEDAYLERRGLAEGRRLSCAIRVLGDLMVDVPPESQVHRQVVRKGVDVRPFIIDPVIRLHYVEVAQPTLASPASDLRRLGEALAREWGLSGLDIDDRALRELQSALRAGDSRVTVAVRDERVIAAVWPGLRERLYGIAIDIGSTTLAAHLTDLSSGEVLASAGAMNPQIRLGEDLMSRVSYLMLNPGGETEMTESVREALDGLIGELTATARIERTEIVEIAVVGNPIMHHLFLGLDPSPLGTAPFTLATDEAVTRRAADVGLTVHSGARVYVLPCVAGHVGADTAGAILSEMPHKGDRLQLLVDVGTNAEIVLGNRHRLVAASSPTGPAFEGAQISGGQRATPGAIERVRIDRESLEPRFKVIGSERWSDQPGFAASTRRTGVTGICGSGIIEVIAEMYLAGILTADGVIDGSLVARSPRVVPEGRTFSYVLWDGPPRLAITQTDVRAIQLAKAALYAGARLLMDRFGVDSVDEIRLAGAFGSHLSVTHAMVLGLIPDANLAHVRSAGNAAGTGALIALLSRAARTEIESIVRTIEKIETAIEPRFGEHFVEAMAIPHRSAEQPNLGGVIELPARPPAGQTVRDRRLERRRKRAVLSTVERTP